MSVLEIHDVTAGYGDAAILRGVSVTVNNGELVTVIGPNGSGKSTLMKTILGLLTPTDGQILFESESIVGDSPETIVRKGISYVPQSSNVFPSLTITENLEMGAFLRQGDCRPRISEILDLFPDLRGKEKEAAGRLSGGQRQMLALARALMLDPNLLLLDEPTASMDPDTADTIRGYLENYQRRTNATILLASHNMSEVERLCDHVLVLKAGQIVDRGSPSKLMARFGRHTLEEVFLDIVRGQTTNA